MGHLLKSTLGDFLIQELLGKGSMGKVYLARQISLRRDVALKVLEEGLFTPGENIKRFIREATALARLEHSNIVPVYAAGEEAPFYYFAMRRITGGTLMDAMKQGLQIRTGVEWTYQICEALAYAHRLGVVHRDLKPTNILIQDGQAFLSDFGLAHLRDCSTITRQGFPMGTPLYMSPEQTLGESAGPQADCFALGVVLHQLVTGQHPFIDDTFRNTQKVERRTILFERIRAARYQPVSDKKIPEELQQVLSRSLVADLARRYADASQMLLDLKKAWRRIQDDHPVLIAVDFDTELHQKSKKQEHTTEFQTTLVTSPQPVEVGSKFAERRTYFGRYEVLKEIGHGGQGIVFLAHDPMLQRNVALKVLQAPFQAHPEMLALFHHEACVAARLSHPHIITILDFGIKESMPYLTMPLVEGPSLDKLIGEPLPLPFCLRVLMQTAEALEYAHECGVAHLDIKPGNILLRYGIAPVSREKAPGFKAPSILLTDFTMARWIAASESIREQHGRYDSKILPQFGGTLTYAAPEQLDRSTESGPASDFYALGVVFYEMLTGKRLFHGAMNAQEILARQTKIEPPSALFADLNPALDRLCLDLLKLDPTARLQDGSELVAQAARLFPRSGRDRPDQGTEKK